MIVDTAHPMAVCAALLYGISFAVHLPRSSGDDLLRGHRSSYSAGNLTAWLQVHFASAEVVGGLDDGGDIRLVRAPSVKAQPMMAAVTVVAIALYTIQSVK